jgi:hypothetical protein
MADTSSDRYVLLNQLADQFAARYRRGERPSLQEYCDHYPELADDIREFFPSLVEMEQMKKDVRAVEVTSDQPAPPINSETSRSCVKSDTAGWEWCMRPSRSLLVGGWRSSC